LQPASATGGGAGAILDGWSRSQKLSDVGAAEPEIWVPFPQR